MKRAKTRTKGTKRTIGPSFLILSLPCFIFSLCIFGKFSSRPRHTYPSNDDNFDRALYNEGYRCPVKELNIVLFIRHTPFLSDAVDVACFSNASSFSLNNTTKSRKTREVAISEPFLDRLFSNLDGVAVV